MSAPHTRLKVVAGAAQAMTPQERIDQHVEGIKQAFREIHPDIKEFGKVIEIGTDDADTIGSHLFTRCWLPAW